ncbi:scaffolding protein [Bacillus thuringiensis]|uniref:Scaffolding protein n=1 Tax=Bacillus thuringiensis TaxID=1428 RepID=A0A9X7GK38_BACTU|nr:phage scaffolding protein [Bacillus thuringiensis]PGH85775.1 scaffolding protein [Bacillus thuringiensis]
MPLQEKLGEELYKQVTAKLGDNKIAIVSDGNWIPKDKFDHMNTEMKTYKQQLKERDTQLTDLQTKAAGHDELTAQIATLTEQNKQSATEFQTKLEQQSYDFALRSALTGAKVKNSKAVEALLNKENIKLDGENLLGLDDQLKALRESDAYLFESEQQQQVPNFSVGNNQTQSSAESQQWEDAFKL